MFSQGYDRTTDLVQAALLLGVIEKAGAFYTVGDQKLQGKEKLVQYLHDNEEAKADLEHTVILQIKEMRMGKKVLAAEPASESEISETDDEA